VIESIVPRWEWRAFAGRLGDADDQLAARRPEREHQSDEIYLVAVDSEASVKARDGLLDIKRLERVGDGGLEQWRPVLKAAFPLPRADVRGLLDALGARAGTLDRDAYTLDQLIAEVVAPCTDLLAVKVHKRRAHYTVGGCMAERSELRTDHGDTRTICLESEDPARVIGALRELGLHSHRNVSVPRELKAMAGIGARRYAVIDVGTNSVKFRIEERAADGSWRSIVDRAEVTRLGEDLHATGRLGDGAIARTTAAVTGMITEAGREHVEEIAAIGTAGLRIAPNRSALIDAVREQTGVEVEVITGEDEARLAYAGAISALDAGDGSLVVFDTGGGSSQFTIGHWDRVDESFSLNIGAVRLTERYGLDGIVDDATLASVLDAIGVDLARIDGRPVPESVVGMGGAVTNLAAVKHGLATYDRDVVHGTILDRAEIDRQIELYRVRDGDERRLIIGLQPNRAEVILAGACIVRTVLAKLGRESLTVSDRGLRHGLLVERFRYATEPSQH
jgi:exopolyphosphatase/guanosine-5'-triphosphate,3'-diphosphate pyrophosphatase